MIEIVPGILCPCGYREIVTEATGGQSLFGTAASVSNNHDARCSYNSTIRVIRYDKRLKE